jgi:hypothetical protein
LTCPSGQVNAWSGATVTTSAGSPTATGSASTPISTAGRVWLQNAIQALIPVPAIAKLVQHSALGSSSVPHFILKKRDTNDDFCNWWGNIKCATYVDDEYLRMMHFSEEQIAYVNSMKPITCAAVQAINQDTFQNSTAALENFLIYNPESKWTPPKQCL